MYKEIKKCLICGNINLVPIINLGEQALTGIFPRTKEEKIETGPLRLVKCEEDENGKYCGLLQLQHIYGSNKLYGEHYGYRSGLNQSMLRHLHEIVEKVTNMVTIQKGDLIIDIGSNDSTLLQGYSKHHNEVILLGIDPTGTKFKKYYPSHIQLIPDFFSKKNLEKEVGNKKAKIITSIAMFYDLQDPIAFMQEIYDVLDENGIWLLEQSYMPKMLEMNAYDTICHEHLEYYRLKQIKWMTDIVGLKILDVQFNNVNGGSFSVIAGKNNSLRYDKTDLVDKILFEEKNKGLDVLIPYNEFVKRVFKHRDELLHSIEKIKRDSNKILGYGASTKGNVILQFCNITEKDIPYIAEVNEDKFGSYTPGTLIPIVSESKAKDMMPDYFMVLPWHFRTNIIERETKYLASGKKLLFPLPDIEVV